MQTVIERLINIIKEDNIKKVTILGHDNIDEDSCISALLLQYALAYYGVEGEIKIISQGINEHTLEVLEKLGHDMNKYLSEETTEEDYLILVDHYCTSHKGKVIGCIDHHPTTQRFNYSIYENDRASACCKKIYDYIIEAYVPINREIINTVVYGVMIDTFAFKSSRGTQEDKEWVEKMVEKYQLDYEEMYADALRLTNLNKSVEELGLMNLKAYDFGGYKIKSTYIQVDREPEQLEQILEYLLKRIQAEKLTMWVFLLVDVAKVQTIEYRIGEKTIEKISHEKLTSRAQGIMPQIEKLFVKSTKSS